MLRLSQLRKSRLTIGLMIASVSASCQPIGMNYESSFSTGNPPTAQDLAAELDGLEREIDRYGSVAAQQPSVWGQARLTKYREEFETQMSAQLTAFQPTLQGSLSRTDQAYAADALALSYTAQAAATGGTGGTSGSGGSSSSSSSSSGGGGAAASTPNAFAGAPANPLGVFDPFNNVTRNAATLAPTLGFASYGKNGVSLEPTLYLDEMKRYIDHLHDLRRMSDGDDTADAPGYSLNLVRIPVSVLPGSRTQQRTGQRSLSHSRRTCTPNCCR